MSRKKANQLGADVRKIDPKIRMSANGRSAATACTRENPDLELLKLLFRVNALERPNKEYTIWFNCASSQAPTGKPRQHMKKVEALVAKHTSKSGGKVKARFLSASSFDLSI